MRASRTMRQHAFHPSRRGQEAAPQDEVRSLQGLLKMAHGYVSSAASRSQCRPRRHAAQRQGRRAAGSGARGTGRDRGRRRRHHRSLARGSPPHPRRRHGAAEGGDFQTAEFRDGGDRGHAADRAGDQAACGVPGAGTPRGAHHRGRPRRGRAAQRAGAVHRAVERCRRAGVAVHRRRPRPDRDGGQAARAGDRNSHRRLVRRRGRRPGGQGGSRVAAHRRRRQRWRARPASKSMPATASIMRPRRRSRACPRSWS